MNKFNPKTSTYHAILFKQHGNKAKELVTSSDINHLLSKVKQIKLTNNRPEPPQPKNKLRLWEDLETAGSYAHHRHE